VRWVQVVRDRVELRTVMNTVMSFGSHERNLLHQVSDNQLVMKDSVP
jgi:hypothetical protein